LRIPRAEGFMGVDAGSGSLQAALAKADVVRLGGTIAGTHACRLYEGELEAMKVRKDLLQAEILVRALIEDRPDLVADCKVMPCPPQSD
jgi:hypothetical protein